MRMKLVAAAVLSLSASAAWAFEPFVVKDIRVEGLQRTEPGTVFNYLPVKAGDTFTEGKAKDAIKALFATGFFDDVRVEAEGNVVIVDVVERPVIAQLTINGAKEIDKDQIKKSLKTNGFAESRIFDQSLLDQAVLALKREYYGRGKYSVEITPEVTHLERNRVAVTLNINEGITAKIKSIHIVGAKAFSEGTLVDQLTLTTGGWLSWLTKDDQYSKQKLSADLEKLKAFYQNQGYIEFNIDSTQVSMSADKEQMFLTINVTEGKRYTISDIKFAGNLIVPEAELRKLLQVKSGDVFDREKVNESVNSISDRLGNDGYAFANVNVVPDLDREHQKVAFTLFVDPGRKTYVRHVNISGNTKTRDEVIRRELRQMEGAPYASDKVKRSKERVDLLGFFETVNVETPAVPETPDQVDMNVSVKERPTGSISAGVGFVQGEGVQLSASVSQNNVLGSGKAATIGFSTGSTNKYANISFTDPYFTADGVSLGYDLYMRKYTPSSTTENYNTRTIGAALRFGVPVTEFDRINFSIGPENTDVTVFSNSPQRYLDFVNKYGPKNTTLLGTASWNRDTRDSALWPTKGHVFKVGVDAGLPGGQIEYYRLTHQEQWFFPLSKTFTLMLNGEVGFANGYGKTAQLPFFQNFYLGGIGSVRGYDNGSLGMKDPITGDYLGGTRKVVANAELLFPFPGMKDNKSIRASVFMDAGSLWDNNTPGDTASQELRYSAGGAFTWLSPVGPMKFSIATPLRKREGDKIQRFQFQLGTVF